jgi:hypothetical protein
MGAEQAFYCDACDQACNNELLAGLGIEPTTDNSGTVGRMNGKAQATHTSPPKNDIIAIMADDLHYFVCNISNAGGTVLAIHVPRHFDDHTHPPRPLHTFLHLLQSATAAPTYTLELARQAVQLLAQAATQSTWLATARATSRAHRLLKATALVSADSALLVMGRTTVLQAESARILLLGPLDLSGKQLYPGADPLQQLQAADNLLVSLHMCAPLSMHLWAACKVLVGRLQHCHDLACLQNKLCMMN